MEEALVVDVDHHEPDLVQVAGQHDARGALGVQRRGRVAGDVGRNGGERLGLLAPQPGGGGLESRWAGGIQQLLQEGERALVHLRGPSVGGVGGESYAARRSSASWAN